MTIEQLSFPHHQRTVHAAAYRPEGSKPIPCVILCHGYNGYQEDTAACAKYLAENGVAAICITFCGGSTRDLSGFPTPSMTLETERDDILSVINAIKDDPLISHIFLYGESMGGMACVLASAVCGSKIAGLSLLYPALCIADNWREKYPKAEDIPEITEFWGMKLGKCFFTGIRDLQIFSVLPSYHGPVLLIHGEEDPVVPIAYSRKAADLYQDVQFFPFPNEGHGFSEPGQKKAAQLLLGFVQKHSGKQV